MSAEIQLVQIPIIKHSLINVGLNVKKRINDLQIDKQVVTEDTIKSLKQLRADLNKENKALGNEMKDAMLPVTSVVDDIRNQYKENILNVFKDAETLLKAKIGDFEIRLKNQKRKDVEAYFEELCLSEKIDFLKFKDVGIEINLSTTLKKYNESCNVFIQRIKDDVLLIESMEYAVEMMAEYKSNGFNSSLAITTINKRKEAEKLEKDRLRQKETERRETMLRGLSMTYRSMTKTFNWVQDENITVRQHDIENLPKDEFNELFVKIESKIKSEQEKFIVDKPKVEVMKKPETETRIFSAPVSVVAPKKAIDPLPGPKKEEPIIEEEVFTATFEATASMPKLNALIKYMKNNEITFKDI